MLCYVSTVKKKIFNQVKRYNNYMYLFNDGEENDLQSIDQNVILYQINLI